MFLSQTVFLLIVIESMPVQSNTIPLIGIYFFLGTGLIATSLIASVAVLCVYQKHSETKPVPQWLRRVMCLKNTSYRKNLKSPPDLVGNISVLNNPFSPRVKCLYRNAEKDRQVKEWKLVSTRLNCFFVWVFGIVKLMQCT